MTARPSSILELEVGSFKGSSTHFLALTVTAGITASGISQ